MVVHLRINIRGRQIEYLIYAHNIKYILVCQLLRDFNWIEWGTSIRGAWFETDNPRYILDELEWWDDEPHFIEKVPFSVENMRALIEFMEE